MIFVDNKPFQRYILNNKCAQQTNQTLASGILWSGVLDPHKSYDATIPPGGLIEEMPQNKSQMSFKVLFKHQ